MNRVQYKTDRQQRPRTRIGHEVVEKRGRLAYSAIVGVANMVQAAETTAGFSIWDDSGEFFVKGGQILRVVRWTAHPSQANRSASEAGETEEPKRPDPRLSSQHIELVTDLIEGALGYATVESTELSELVADDGTVYPLRVPIDLAKRRVGGLSRVSLMRTAALGRLTGEDADEESALANFSASFHQLVKTHWMKPPHVQTADDEEINRVLEHLVDWDRYRAMNPIEQPLWGQLVEVLDDGDLHVHWMLGPDETRGATTVVRSKDVCPALRLFPIGTWFYGSGKVYPDRIAWIDQPVAVPDPHDPVAIREAWDLIPRHVVSEVGAWPLKDKE